MDLLDRYELSPERAWLGAFCALVAAFAGGALVFTKQVYYGFLWRYLLGPVKVDATTADCLVRFPDEGQTLRGEAAQGCSTAYENAFVVTEGYTIISTLFYVLVLAFMIGGIYLLLNKFDLSPYREFFYALVPFMLFGGALRTVEDSFIAALRAGETPLLEYPASALLISPFIYFTVFAIALGAFLLSQWLEGSGYVKQYTYPLGGIGTLCLILTFGYLFVAAITTEYVTFKFSLLATVLILATVLAVGTYVGSDSVWPNVNEKTGLMGLVVIWGHAIDGVANVVANDWSHVWNLGEYGAKHPFNQFLMDTTNAVQGGEEIAGLYVGDAWPFVLVKLAAPVLILTLFDDEFFDESPRFSVMLLGAVVAVGLGPGTRDMLRIAFAI